MGQQNLGLVDRALDDSSVAHESAVVPAPVKQLVRATEADRGSLDGELLRYLLRSLGNPPLRITLWNGVSVATENREIVATAKIANRVTMWKLFLDPEYQFGECYSDGTLEIEGDMLAFFVALFPVLGAAEHRGSRLLEMFRRRGSQSHTEARDNIHHHYDVGNDFYKLWLDSQLAYTCAYFPTPDISLEEAQIAKMDHVCRKLCLRPGEKVVEAGCGWGALALHMARNYGVSVKAYNISREQLAYARERARNEGLQHQVEFIEADYRDITGRFDAFVSVGMLEHVGRENYGALSHVIDRVLAPSGRGLIHSIGLNRSAPLNPWIEKRIFPGAEPPSLREMMEIFETCAFSVLDVENLRQHYALTLKHWLKRFEDARDQIKAMYDRRFTRMWQVYLCGSEAAFQCGSLQLFQVVFAREQNNDLPLTRAQLYHTQS
jgi:cyclopropane-fatty-acyl-phospholipid synthase